MPTCETCKFWQDINTHYGTCHRFPPIGGQTNFNADGMPRWPLTSGTDWCGEYQAKMMMMETGNG